MLRTLTATLLLLTFTAAGLAQEAETQVLGRVRGETYTAPTGAYSVTIPVMTELGGTVSDQPNVVVFQDSYNVHVSIGCFPQDATQRWEHSTRGLRDYLAFFFADFVFPDFLQMFRGSRVESMVFLPEINDGALLVYSLLPGGTMFSHRLVNVGPNTPIPVAKRANLLFVKYGYVYVISMELAERSLEGTSYKKTQAEEDALLRARLDVLLESMQYHKSAAAN
jgi:hypothetical protein